MSDIDSHDKDLIAVLQTLVADWDRRARQAREVAAQGGRGTQSATYFAGIAFGLGRAIGDLRGLLDEVTASPEGDGPSAEYAARSWDDATLVLERAGLKVSEMYQDADHVFTVVFPPMPPMDMEERIERLTAADETVVILEHGRTGTNRAPYIDFAFKA